MVISATGVMPLDGFQNYYFYTVMANLPIVNQSALAGTALGLLTRRVVHMKSLPHVPGLLRRPSRIKILHKFDRLPNRVIIEDVNLPKRAERLFR